MSIAAVVVTYNRLGYLKECLAALKGQTRTPDEIIVIDNGSTDGTLDHIRAEHPDVILFETGANLGGAGGFAWGLEIAMGRGHDGAWIMDDDARPEFDAFEPLATTFERMDPEPSFLASVVTNGRHTLNRRNPPTVNLSLERQVAASEYDGFAVDTATFVGVLVNLRIARKTHLPYMDYFIWIDDSEYTHRLSRMGAALALPASRVNHPDLADKVHDIGGRLFYHIRNNLWFLREKQVSPAAKVRAVGNVVHQTFYYGGNAKNKAQWATSAVKGYWQGILHRPRRIYPGELLATLPESRRRELVGVSPLAD